MKPHQSSSTQETLVEQALFLHKSGRLPEANTLYKKLLIDQPNHPQLLGGSGRLAIQLGNFAEALELLTAALQVAPNQPNACCNRGIALAKLNRQEEAIASYNQAIALKPDFALAYYNRGNAQQELQRHAEAVASYSQAIALQSDYADAYYNCGNVLQYLKNFTAAILCYDQAIALKPDYAEAYWNKALVNILTGNFEAGWQLFEWRWQSQLKPYVRDFTQPLWLGDSDLAGQTLLIYPEQGYGDFIQFCRYLPMLEKIAAHIVLETPPALMTLISSLQGRFTLLEQNSPLPAFDRQCPIMSLPLAFRTSVATIPATVPYLSADPEKLQFWQQKLGKKTGLRVGLAWSGASAHTNDHNRSISLARLAPLLALPVEFHCLQNDLRSADTKLLENFKNLQSHHTELQDFSDTAALIAAMDLVISVDTAVAHLAGALGKTVWILLPFVPDYRWLLDRSDSPWYPSATLFRQPAFADWQPVIAEIREKLVNYQA